MTYPEAVKFFQGLQKFGIRPGLERITQLLELLGDPHKAMKFIHVGGTNGKGSTAVMIARVLEDAGLRTGLYISPHVESWRERVSINGRNISRDDFAYLIEHIAGLCDGISGKSYPTQFEVLTALGFEYFNKESVDIVVMEVGMGGAFDATNVIPMAEVSIITNISSDHADYLGSRIEQIAAEKAGIIKEKSFVITAEEGEDVLEIIRHQCFKQGAELLTVPECVTYLAGEIKCAAGHFAQECSIGTEELFLEGLSLSMIGSHQVKNAAVALLAVQVLVDKGYRIAASQIRSGLQRAWFPGRVEIINRSPLIILDCGHNAEGIRSLKAVLKALEFDRLILVTGVLDDKDREEITRIWGSSPSKVIVTKPESPRGRDWEQLARFFCRYNANVRVIEEIEKAIRLGFSLAGPKDCLCVSGSFSLLKPAREVFETFFRK